MAVETPDLSYELMIKLGFPKDREPQARGNFKLPAGTTIVSADTHWSIPEDIWYEGFPAHLKDRAPRVWYENGVWQVGFNGKSVLPPHYQDIIKEFDQRPGTYTIEPRIADLDKEGITQEIAFGNTVNAFFKFPDFEVREWMFRLYNRHLADVAKRSGGRFHGVGIANYWDMSKARACIEEICELGLKTFMLPQFPGKFPDGRDIKYAEAEMDPLWSAIEDSGLPVCFHIGEAFKDEPGGMGIAALVNFGGFREQLGALIFGGIFDRHPRLQVVFAEAGINWAATALRDAEVTYGSQKKLLDPQIKHPPRYYWDKHCYTTFMTDPIGLKLIDEVGGPDHVLWSSDYPHCESTLGYGWQAMQAVIDAVSTPDDARKILGGNAIKVFHLD